MSVQDVLHNNILPQLDKCREAPTGDNDRAWTACCPAHDDKTPSFGVALAHDGKILMHCWSGCSINEICYALGIEPTALFPDDGKRRRVDPSEDAWAIEIADSMVARGKALRDADRQRYREALHRTQNNLPSPRPELGHAQRGAVAVGKREAERMAIIRGSK
jgi:hypothetical protein